MKPQPAELPQAEKLTVDEIISLYLSGEAELICVLGPTASGKTRYAVKLAQALREHPQIAGAEIISADSRQVYRGMDIGTGKDLKDYEDIPYHLIDIADAGTQYNVYSFQRDFVEAYSDIRSRGCVPILCGGTGLYLNSVLSGYDFRSSKPLSEVRVQAAADAQGPDCALPRKSFVIGTLVSRELRNERIDRRLDARLKEGMVEEIKGLLERGVPASTLIAYGLEYKFVTLYLQGELSFEQMREQLAIAIHQFAKRQMTWFRGMERSGIKIHWVEV